jgi:ECF transporter S component (folate family)
MRTVKSEQLYSTPFSKAYWRDAAAELKDIRVLVIAAMLIALRVALKSLGIPIAADLKINIAFFVNAYGAMIFGPVVAALAAAVSDTLGCIIFPQGVYFFPFIFIEIAGSVTFALFLYRSKVTGLRALLSRFCICFFVNIVLNTPIYALYNQIIYGRNYDWLHLPRIIKNMALFPVEAILLTMFLQLMEPLTRLLRKNKICRAEMAELKFTKKSIAIMVALVLVSAGLTTWYSIDHYNTTSLSASYTTDERVLANKGADLMVKEKSDDWDDVTTVTVVESVFPKFMDDHLTYTVAVYTVKEGAEGNMDGLWKLSKSKAAKHEDLSFVARYTIVVNKETDTIVSFQKAK